MLQPCIVPASNGDGNVLRVVLELYSLLTRRGGNVYDTQLPLRLRGHCPRVVQLGDLRLWEMLRIRAGAALTTSDVRNGKLAKMILSEDSVVYQWRYTNDVGLVRMAALEMMPVDRTSIPSRRRSVSSRRRGVEIKGIGTIMIKTVLNTVGPRVTAV